MPLFCYHLTTSKKYQNIAAITSKRNPSDDVVVKYFQAGGVDSSVKMQAVCVTVVKMANSTLGSLGKGLGMLTLLYIMLWHS